MSAQAKTSWSVIRLSPILVGLLLSLALSLFLSILVGVLLHFTSLSEAALPTAGLLIMLVSVFGGGSLAARLAGSRGLVMGFNVALAYLLLALIFSLFFQAKISFSLLASRAVLAFLAGALGGVFGLAFGQRA